ncbi:MAG: hypothetical protein JWN60_2673 [Acidobacteria bacterium]|jgi:hypothetical protein|nr:hypothetical protein [Acidobacteriota bacterium]
MKRSFTIVIFSFLLAVNLFAFPAHTFHTSLTRIDYNAKDKLAEISIQLFTHDLVPALERFAKKSIDLEKTPDIDKLILQYLEANLILKDAKGAAKKLVWVGKEQKIDIIYVYVEIPLEKDFEGYTLQNTVFFETFKKQANLVVARYNEKKVDLLYKVGDIEKLISPEAKN